MRILADKAISFETRSAMSDKVVSSLEVMEISAEATVGRVGSSVELSTVVRIFSGCMITVVRGEVICHLGADSDDALDCKE